MKAIQIDEYGGAERLREVEIPDPVAGKNQVLVRVHATTFNAIDAKRASGNMRQIMPLTFPWVPGGDFSGVVEAVGEGVDEFTIGDEVFGYSAGGGAYAELIAADVSVTARKPHNVNHAEAASLALVTQTASQALDAADLKSGQTILIQGAAGGVGNAAVQFAHLRGAHVIATASAESAARLRELGADEVIDYKTTPFESVVSGIDVVLDAVGGETQQRSFGVLKPGGILIALSQPPSPEEAAKHGVRAVMLQTQASSAGLTALAERIEAGEIRPAIGATYALADAARAWEEIPSLHVAGKVVFVVVG